MIKGAQLSVAALIVLSTYDSVVMPLFRISVADASIVAAIIFLGITKRGLYQSTRLTSAIFALVVSVNSIIYIFHVVVYDGIFDLALLISGFLRPALFVFLAINFYYSLKLHALNPYRIYTAISLGALSLSLIVMAQYFGYWPAHYHNNPAFGESGRWTLFSEGWRPTGLSNEASFVGIFLVLILSLQLYLKNRICLQGSLLFSMAPYVTLLGCYFTTSRIALILGLLAMSVYASNKIKILLIPLSALVFFVFAEGLISDRYLSIFSIDGDASTLERYGSAIAYLNAIVSGKYFFGTGYLNGSNVAMQFADQAVISILDERNMPAFSLPLQLLLELGVPLFIITLALLYKHWRLITTPLLFVLLASMLTGVQNFVFVYIFISLATYARYSFHK